MTPSRTSPQLARGWSAAIRCLRRYSTATSDLQTRLTEDMIARKPPPIYSILSMCNSSALNRTLQPHLPPGWSDSPDVRYRPTEAYARALLPPAHHLVYFNPAISADQLLPDGTDPLQSPGAPFTRRMWAGGSLRSRSDRYCVQMSGAPYVCIEGVRDVTVKGVEGDEKVFVGIERRIGSYSEFLEANPKFAALSDSRKSSVFTRLILTQRTSPEYEAFWKHADEEVRKWLWTEHADDFGNALLVERRNIVFMKDKTPEAAAKSAAVTGGGKILKPSNPPDPGFTHSLMPDANLLFRYSALTFNAHRIHLDRGYCREVEGHRNLLVHGPLQFTLLMTMLQNRLKEKRIEAAAAKHGSGYMDWPWSDRMPRITSVEYRNLAPLYADEPIKLCGREIGPTRYELWAETPEGGLAIRLNATTDDPAHLPELGSSYDQSQCDSEVKEMESRMKQYAEEIS